MYAEERQHAIATLVAERGRLAVSRRRRAVRRHHRDGAPRPRRCSSGPACCAGCTAAPCPAGALTLVEPGLGERHGTRSRGEAQDRRRGPRPPPRRRRQPDPRRRQHHGRPGRRAPRRPRGCYVATNSVPIAARLSVAARHHAAPARRPGPRASPRPPSATSTVRALADLRVDVAFLGTNGISAGHGFSTPDEAEAAIKRAMIARRRSASSCWPTAASSAASTSCGSPPSTTSTSWSPTTRPIPASSPSSRRWGSRWCVA